MVFYTLTIFEVNIVAEQKQTYWRIFCVLSVCISPNTFTDPCPTAATCVLCNFTYKLSIVTVIIIGIQITKLLAKLSTESLA